MGCGPSQDLVSALATELLLELFCIGMKYPCGSGPFYLVTNWRGPKIRDRVLLYLFGTFQPVWCLAQYDLIGKIEYVCVVASCLFSLLISS